MEMMLHVKAKFPVAIFVLGLCFVTPPAQLSGQRLYPVQGPQASLTPQPVFVARLTGASTGNFTVSFSNGETFKGKWATVSASPGGSTAPRIPDVNQAQPDLAFAWDAIFGQGYFVAQVLGESVGRTIITGDRGTVLQAEFFNGRVGVAADSKGNVYKIVW